MLLNKPVDEVLGLGQQDPSCTVADVDRTDNARILSGLFDIIIMHLKDSGGQPLDTFGGGLLTNKVNETWITLGYDANFECSSLLINTFGK